MLQQTYHIEEYNSIRNIYNFSEQMRSFSMGFLQ